MAEIRKEFTLVVPTLNEAENIVTVLERARQALSQLSLDWEILLVDDESADGTPEIVRRYSETHAGSRLLERHAQKGLAGAIYLRLETHRRRLSRVYGRRPPASAGAVARISGQSVPGLRRRNREPVSQRNSMEARSLPRRTISPVSALASRSLQRGGLRVRDPISGFFVLRRQCIEGLHFQPTGFRLLLEILAKGHIC